MILESVFMVCVYISSVLSANQTSLVRQKRQTSFTFPNTFINPLLFQYNDQIPQTSSQITAARCQTLAGQFAPDGCFYVPVIVDSNNLPLNCRLECPNFETSIFPFQLQSLQLLGQFESIAPSYLTNNAYTIVDQNSNLDTFTGESYFLFTRARTTTTTRARTPTTTRTTTRTTTTPVRTVTTTTTAVTTTTVPPVTTTTVAPLTPNQLITACIDSGRNPGAGCSFGGNGAQPPLLTCPVICAQGLVGTTCDNTVGTPIDKCLCQTGKVTLPSPGCTYSLTTTLPPTCPQLCLGGGSGVPIFTGPGGR